MASVSWYQETSRNGRPPECAADCTDSRVLRVPVHIAWQQLAATWMLLCKMCEVRSPRDTLKPEHLSKVKHARFTCRFMSSNEMSARSSCHHAVNIYCSSHGSNHLHTGASSLRRRCAVSCVGQACGSCCIAGTSMWSPRYQSCSMCYPHRVPHPGLPDTAESLLASVLAV